MTKMILALAALVLSNSVAHAGIDLSNNAQAASAFKSGRAPTVKELNDALWMATSLASDPLVIGGRHGSYPTGRIKDEAGEYRQITRFTTKYKARGVLSVTASVQYTEADTGVELGRTVHFGDLAHNGLRLFTSGDAGACATRSLCRMVADGRLVCAQMNDDHRKQCTDLYKSSLISSYLGYTPVHP